VTIITGSARDKTERILPDPTQTNSEQSSITESKSTHKDVHIHKPVYKQNKVENRGFGGSVFKITKA
jgi:hypothetical protein